MRSQELCNNTYRDLLAKLGELTIQKKSIESQITAIESQLLLLNALVPELTKLENELRKNNDVL